MERYLQELITSIEKGASDLTADAIYNVIDTHLPPVQSQEQTVDEFIHDLILNLENLIG